MKNFPDLEKPVIYEMIDRHVDEAAFLWLRRDQGMHAHDVYPVDIQQIDQKLVAHFHGIRVAGSVAWRITKRALERFSDAGEMFVASTEALHANSDTFLDFLLEFVSQKPQVNRGFLSACAWCDEQKALPAIKRLFSSSSLLHRELGIAACAHRRFDPGSQLDAAFKEAGTSLQARAFRAVGEMGLVRYRQLLERHLPYLPERQQYWAAWSLVMLGDRATALERLCNFAQDVNSDYQKSALQLAARALSIDKARLLSNNLAQVEAMRQQAIIACGIIGLADSLPWLIQQMRVPHLANIAGEAFATITGQDLEENQLCVEDLLGDSDKKQSTFGDLPKPDFEKVSRWWESHHSQFDLGQRYLLGHEKSHQQLVAVLKNGPQSIRRGVAIDLVLSGRHAYLINTSQSKQLVIWKK